MKNILIALFMIPALSFSQWEMDFDEDWAAAVSRVSVSPTAFVTTWVTTAPGQSVTLPLRSGYTYDFTVDWGDGSGIGTVTSFDAAAATHEYAAAGTYTVKIEGVLSAWYFNNAGSKDSFRTVTQWGSVGAGVYGLAYGFSGASASTSFASPVPPTWAAVTTLAHAWRGCSGLTSAPDVSALTNVTSLSAAWYGCSGLTTAPDVSALTNVTSLASAWRDCRRLTTVPALPASSTALTTTTGAFIGIGAGMKGTVVELWNTDLFPNITSFANTFTGCTGLDNYDDIPDNWKGL